MKKPTIDDSAARARLVAVLQAAVPYPKDVENLLCYIARAANLAALLRRAQLPRAPEVAGLLARVPQARVILEQGQHGRRSLARVDKLPARPPEPTMSRPVAELAAHLRGRAAALTGAAFHAGASSVVEHACQTLVDIDAMLRSLEEMAEEARRMGPEAVAQLRLMAEPPS